MNNNNNNDNNNNNNPPVSSSVAGGRPRPSCPATGPRRKRLVGSGVHRLRRGPRQAQDACWSFQEASVKVESNPKASSQTQSSTLKLGEWGWRPRALCLGQSKAASLQIIPGGPPSLSLSLSPPYSFPFLSPPYSSPSLPLSLSRWLPSFKRQRLERPVPAGPNKIMLRPISGYF